MIHLIPNSVRFIGPSDRPGEVHVSVNVALPNVPPYPEQTCRHDDLLMSLFGDEPESCSECVAYEAAKEEWKRQVRQMLDLDNESFYGTLAVSGYSLMASKFLALEPDGSEKEAFNAWEVSVAFPDGARGQVLIPIKYEAPFRALLDERVNRKALPTAKVDTTPRPKSAWERLLEDEK